MQIGLFVKTALGATQQPTTSFAEKALNVDFANQNKNH
jgi:hypothetical protein